MNKKQKKMLIRIIISFILFIALRILSLNNFYETILFLITYFIIGYDILKKAINKDIPVTERSLEENIHDIAGIRVICNYVDDVYKVAQLLTDQDDIRLVEVKDYIANPKESGYMSLHLVLEVPIFLSEGSKPIHVEVQLRTIAMDFWASLEHKLKYKTDNNVPEDIKEELQECAKTISELDLKMQNIHNRLNKKRV